ncbi:uncharacterized protein LOC113335214 [Papaver somniferum]|uniref:uncharacterized protein LOC113335214 n=1 Tax=Papaver somniferum TaxID=3469 RepID=UPI000E7032A5|nr:uncharacterized protein LOC113335214 [Papaver somniferum]
MEKKATLVLKWFVREVEIPMLVTSGDPCGHEHIAAKYQEDSKKRGRNIIQKGESSERNMKKKGPMLRSQPTPSEPSQVKQKEIDDTPAHIDKRYLEELPPYIRDYVISINDVPPDGNCGFHVVKEQLGPFTQGSKLYVDNEITYIRQRMKMKLKEKPEFYKRMLSDEDDSLNMQFLRYQIRLHGGNPITRDHWMGMPICGHLIADAFNCVVHYFSKGDSFTCTPKTTICVEQLRRKRVVIALVNNNHFVGLQLEDNCALPPICAYSYWNGFSPDTMLGWCIMYEHNMEMWKALEESNKIIHGHAVSLGMIRCTFV